MKENKGITLIALVITIIVMLILVVVTIRISTNGGLFDYAGRAARETKDAITDETDIANGKITIGGVTYNSIEEYINRDKISSVKLKYKVEGSNIMVYFNDSYTDYLETNSLEDSGDNRNAYEAYIKNKIANIASKKSTEEKENYIVEKFNENRGTTFSTIEEVINERWKNEENFIAEMVATTYEDAINKLYEEICYEYFMIPIEKITLPNNQIIQEEGGELLIGKPCLSRNKTYIYGVTESGTYTFTATDVEGKTAKVDVPVEIPANTKFAIIKQRFGINRITIPITVGTTTWGDFVGQSIFGVEFSEGTDNKIRTSWGNTLKGGNTSPIISTTLIEETEYKSSDTVETLPGEITTLPGEITTLEKVP